MPKQYIVFYPEGDCLDTDTNERISNRELANTIAQGLLQGATVCMPTTWRVTVVDVPNQAIIERKYTQEEKDAFIRLVQHKGSSAAEDLR